MTKKEMPLWAKTGHKKPVTRREFLAAGLLPFAASAFLPSMFSMFSPSRAFAQELACDTASGGLIPLITLNLAGGANIASNFLPRDANGDLLPSYTKLGLGNNTGANALSAETEFGVPAFARVGNNVFSPILNGIRANCDPAALANTAFLAMCVQSQDDTANNRFDISGLAYRAGLTGSYIPNLGTRASATGLNQQPSTIKPPAPLVVQRFGDVVNALGYTRALSTLNSEQQNRLARLVGSLSNSQARKLAQIDSVKHVKDLVECAGIKNTSIVGSGSSAVSPIGNAELLSRWGVNAGQFTATANAQSVIFSTMVYNALMGQSGSVNLEIGGYDYHDGTRTTGDTRDQNAGAVIGRILDTARILQKPVFLYVTSDGSTSGREDATPGTGTWVSDRGDAGASLIFMYQPNGRKETSGFQIGNFTSGQVSDSRTPVGASPEIATQAAFANYCKFNGRMDIFERVLPRGTLDQAALEKVIKVG